jgi:hypothetical protein
MIKLLCDIVVESCWWWCCWNDLVTTLCRCWGDLTVMWYRCWVMLTSHAGDGVVKVTWLWCTVDVESCWRQCCRVMLVMALPSPASDGAVESCWWLRYRVLQVTALLSWCWSWRDVMPEVTWLWCDVATVMIWSWCDVTVKPCCATGVRIYDRSYDVRPESGCTYIISMYNG